MASSKRTEARGPGVGPMAIVYPAHKQASRPRDHLVLQRRQEEETRAAAQAVVDYNHSFEVKTNWERATEMKAEETAVRYKFNALLEKAQSDLSQRRQRLSQLLAQEDAQYAEEMAQQGETLLDRQARMRERAKQLREERESERARIAREKEEQLFLQNCEPLRTLKSQVQCEALWFDREKQLEEKQALKEKEKKEEQGYSQLWQKDYEKKLARETADKERSESLAKGQVHMLRQQMQEREDQRRYEEFLRQTEQEERLEAERLMNEAAALQHEKEVRARFRRNQELDHINRRNAREKARELQEEMELDRRLLNSVLLADSEVDKSALKKQMYEEMMQYQAYLAEQKAADAAREAEIDKAIQADTEKVWQQRAEKWRKERQARQQLMQQVTGVRQQQIAEKLMKHQEALLEQDQENRAFQQSLTVAQKEAEEKKRAERQHRIAYSLELLKQSDMSAKAREAEIAQDRRLDQQLQEASAQQQERTNKTLHDFALQGRSMKERRALY
eukprot:m.58698 g.58698  ORF g.58698 m.58698 type:complete len:505 (-) comp13528_c0_seq1:1048-2562(-)